MITEEVHKRAEWATDALACAIVALVLRVGVVFWAASRFPPAEDGRYYHQLAMRIASGEGYTWLWPDGAVTFAAHYPVGYPAAVGILYAIVGAHPWVAMLFNAVLGALSVYWLHRLVAFAAPRWAALASAIVVAVHPTLVFYTAALMTEGVSAALVVGVFWIALPARDGSAGHARLLALCVMLGTAILIRPQLVLLAPAVGWLRAHWSGSGWRKSLVSALIVTGGSLLVVAPWGARNCVRMEQCVFVSANKGWNLLIGSEPAADGRWISIDAVGVPESCRGVYAEAAKDQCFSEAAQSRIARQPAAWMALMPAKLAATFDDVGAPGWYMKVSNTDAITESGRYCLAIAEAVTQRGLILAAVLALVFGLQHWGRIRWVVGGLAVLALWPAAWLSVLIVAVLSVSAGGWRVPVLGAAAVAIVATAATHSVFFGAARYSMVVWPLLSAVPFAAIGMRSSENKQA